MQATTFKPSHYQEKIFDWVVNGRGDAVVQAAAGSGKTTTLVEAAKLLKSDRAVFLAFNKHIAQQLQTRLGSAMVAKTIHSVGLATLRGAIRKPIVEDNKYGDIGKIYAQEIADDLKRNYAAELRRWARNRDGKEPEEPLSAGQVLGQLKQLAHYTRVTLTHEKDFEAVQEMVDHFGCLNSGLDLKMLHYPLMSMLREGQQIAERQGIIDYDDMLWLPYRWNLEPSKCDWVAIDEAQDVSPAQLDLILKMRSRGGRMIWVGDSHQCQPAGTMVKLTDGTECPIELLKIGDTVITYDRRGSTFVKKGIVNDVAHRFYQGFIYTISANGKQSRCTDSHKWIARWSEKAEGQNTWITYLMRQGSKWRVGVTKMFFCSQHPSRSSSSNFDFGLSFRVRAEGADAAWILKVHSDYSEALAYEQIVAAKFGLPEITFNQATGNNGQQKRFDQKVIDSVYEALYPQDESAIKCLLAHGRKLEFPLIDKSDLRQRRGRSTIFETQACNLISGFMAIPVAPNEITSPHWKKNRSKPQWETINVSTDWFEGKVYSLDIDKYHKYIADGIVTCNSIFGFAGALNDSIDRIVKATNATVLPLSICYRCPTSHIKLAQDLVPSIEAAPNAIEGIVEYISYEKVHSIIAEGDLVISRCTAPVIKLCIELIAKKIPARVRGRDIGKALTAIVKEVAKQPSFDFEKFGYALQAYQYEKISKLQQKKNSESQIESLRDRISGIWVCYQAFNSHNILDFCAEIEELFSDSRSSVVLSTVHRAKGLEERRVFILRPDQLPLRWQNQQQWELQQEFNLKYVSTTRAKEALFFVTDEKPIELKPEDEDDNDDDYEDEDDEYEGWVSEIKF